MVWIIVLVTVNIAMKRHHGQGKHLIGGLLTVPEGQSIIIRAGSMAACMALEQMFRADPQAESRETLCLA